MKKYLTILIKVMLLLHRSTCREKATEGCPPLRAWRWAPFSAVRMDVLILYIMQKIHVLEILSNGWAYLSETLQKGSFSPYISWIIFGHTHTCVLNISSLSLQLVFFSKLLKKHSSIGLDNIRKTTYSCYLHYRFKLCVCFWACDYIVWHIQHLQKTIRYVNCTCLLLV